MAAGDRLFGDMSEPAHAYALGVCAAVGRLREGMLELPLRGDGEPLLGLLRARDPGDIPARYEFDSGRLRLGLALSGLPARWLGALPGDTRRLEFPTLRRELAWAFVRGVFDSVGHVNSPARASLRLRLQRLGTRFEAGLLAFLPLPPDRISKRTLEWEGHNALDLLGHLYEAGADLPDETPLGRAKPFRRYIAWTHRVPPFRTDSQAPGKICWTAVHPDARPPFKQRITDSGYDLTLLYEKKRLGRTVLYGTGIVVQPPFGWYLDVVPRSSIIKTGYLLANNVGVIDRGYRGEIFVPLVKIDPAAPELELPARVVQMVPRPIVHLGLLRTEQSTKTHRGSGGFGSTG